MIPAVRDSDSGNRELVWEDVWQSTIAAKNSQLPQATEVICMLNVWNDARACQQLTYEIHEAEPP